MILGDFNHIDALSGLNTVITEALKWASEHCCDPFTPGRIEILEGKAFVNVEEVALLDRERRQLEAHRKYIDIHVPLNNDEHIGWAVTDRLRHVTQPYDEERDIEFFGDTAQSVFNVTPRQFAIFFPEDAHAPNIGLGNHRKFCVKIPVSGL